MKTDMDSVMHEVVVKNLEDLLHQLSIRQIEFCCERVHHPSDKRTAEKLGMTQYTVTKWRHDGAPLDDVVKLLKLDGAITAGHLLKRHVVKAALKKVRGMESKNEKIAQEAATEVLDRVIGKATQHTVNESTINVNDVDLDL